ncbi:MAG: nuclear transport factor 2 family protein [Acidimicrobiia bacterium]
MDTTTAHSGTLLDSPRSPDAHDRPGWSAAGLFLEALALRDFAAMGACLHPDLRFRALVPRGPFDTTGAEQALTRFRSWFDGPDDFEVVDASIGQVGTRIYLRWRVRMRSASDPGAVRLVEQHAFASAGDRIESLDLLCSGFQGASS